MKKNGFTLIELLAVVVLIGLLTVLIVSKVSPSVNDSKRYVGLASTNNLISAMENYYVNAKMNGNFVACSYNFDSNINTCVGFDFKGDKPATGVVSINDDGVISGTVGFENISFQISDNKIVSDLANDNLDIVDFTNEDDS